MWQKRKALQDAWRALEEASSLGAWRGAAETVDELTGAAEWRKDEESPYFDAPLLRQECRELKRLREERRWVELVGVVSDTLYRHLADISAPELYAVALAGTKHLIREWLAEIEAALRTLVAHGIPGFTEAEKKRRFEQAWKVYGRTALMLSGGATWGFHHLGVVKALFENGLLPDILSGASTGAMVAGGICTRNDKELAELFADTDQMRLDGLKPASLVRMVRDRAWLVPEQLDEVLRHNIGERTFAEAYRHSGRVLNIAVSPTRTRQKPRVLSHLTAPDVLVARAAVASSALPGLYPAVSLVARGSDGKEVPYLPTERWVDGSIYEDLPKLRLARMHNVNHFIVSQTNPHVMPFARHRGERGVMPAIAGIISSSVRNQGSWAADLVRRATRPGSGPVRQFADRAHALISQDYHGDIDIHPEFHAGLLRKVVVNPTREDLRDFIQAGERAVWPKVAMIEDQTRLGRVFAECVRMLSAS